MCKCEFILNTTLKEDKVMSRLEQRTKQVITKVFPLETFVTACRPDWLKGMDLDFYCEEGRLAVDCRGKQHYEFCSFFHRTQDRFERQKERDELKRQLCLEHGVTLVEVPYHLSTEQVEQLISRYVIDV